MHMGACTMEATIFDLPAKAGSHLVFSGETDAMTKPPRLARSQLTLIAGWLLLAHCLAARPVMAQKVEHPLDPLTFQEHWAVLEILRDAGHLNADTRFSMVNLREPDKELVWGWSNRQDFPRPALVAARHSL